MTEKTMELLKGKVLAEKIKEEIKVSVNQITKRYGHPPRLVAVIASEDSGARIYAESQKKTAESLGIDYSLAELKEDISQDAFEKQIQSLNKDKNVTGIILQMPLPKQIKSEQAIAAMDPKKDVEGLHVDNMGLLAMGKARIMPPTAQAALELILSTGKDITGLHGTVVGVSQIVGKPVALMLIDKHVTTTVARSIAARNGTLEENIRRADILVVAIGKAKMIPGDWIKEDAIVIDVGINRVDGKVVGDVDFDTAQEKAAFITPVPGGVGPLTVTILMQNVVKAFEWQHENN